MSDYAALIVETTFKEAVKVLREKRPAEGDGQEGDVLFWPPLERDDDDGLSQAYPTCILFWQAHCIILYKGIGCNVTVVNVDGVGDVGMIQIVRNWGIFRNSFVV